MGILVVATPTSPGSRPPAPRTSPRPPPTCKAGPLLRVGERALAHLLIDAAERGSTQFIVNTHSPFLPQYFMGVDAACILHCRRAGRRTVFEPLEAALPSFEQQVEA